MNAAQVNQGKLESALNTLLPNERFIKNARKEIGIKNPDTGEYLEVDLWYPELHLCFEYQDDYHYHPTWYCQIPLPTVIEKDNLKRSLLQHRSETLILVPCWWDGKLSSLQSTINFHRPELLHNTGDLITANPQTNFFPVGIVPKNMKLMLASFPTSLDTLTISNQNPWWLGEKYDGIRCYWNPGERQMYSRHGLAIELYLPATQLFGTLVWDGEIWSGRGLFLEAQQLATSTDSANWASLRIVCFDEASQQMDSYPFERRYSQLISHFSPEHPVIMLAPRLFCVSQIMLTQHLRAILEGGGEGVILRKPNSLYERGRSASLIKLKASRSDQEALVVKVEENGALLLQSPDGSQFVVQKDDILLHRRAVRGDVVTFTHDFVVRQSTQDHSTQRADSDAHDTRAQAAPSNPVVHRIREDMSWEDVLRNTSVTVRHFLNESHQKVNVFAPRPRGYWSYDKGKNMRAHLETVARQYGLDPLLADDWYRASRQEFMQHRDVRTVVSYYGASLSKALVDLFPELNLDISKFSTTPYSFWEGVSNRRELYERFAQMKDSDPLDAKFWYELNSEELRKFRGVRATMEYYGGYAESVIHLFPELHLEKDKFVKRLGQIPEELTRNLFERFASVQGFDSRTPKNWYNFLGLSFSDFKNYNALVVHRKLRYITKKYYDNNFIKCVMDAFPDIGVQPSKFISAYKHFSWKDRMKEEEWRKEESLKHHRKGASELGVRQSEKLERQQQEEGREERRDVLMRFAAKCNFDPLVVEHWYNASRKKLLEFHGGRSVMRFYDNSFVDAVVSSFPELSFETPKFVSTPQTFSYGGLEGERSKREFRDHETSDVRKQGLERKSGEKSREDGGIKKEGRGKKEMKAVLLDFAKSSNFDPLEADEWYKASRQAFVSHPGGRGLVKKYGNSFVEAVVDLFPELGLERSKFASAPQNHWKSEANRRMLFERYAREKGQDPLTPQFWYSQNPRDMLKFKGMRGAMEYHKGYAEAIIQLFSEIRFDRRKFS